MRLSLSVAAQPARPAPQARAAQPAFRLSQIKHVWVIQVENEGYTQSFGKPAADPYLARTLPREGALLTNYYSIGHHSLDNQGWLRLPRFRADAGQPVVGQEALLEGVPGGHGERPVAG
jgi:hypothetical protein